MRKALSILLCMLIISAASDAQKPAITSFSPASGPVGTLVTVAGTNFSNPTSFIIGGKQAIVISNTGTSLVGMVMPGAVTGIIKITTAGGTAASSTNFTVTPTLYPKAQQGDKLVGKGSAGSPVFFGQSVAISADGNTAIAGGPSDNSNTGAAWIFIRRAGAAWIQQGDKLVGTDGIDAEQGTSVAISADGNTVLIGGPMDNGGVGAAWIFVRKNGIWSQEGSKLVGNDITGIAKQGISVSISADGNTALIGGPEDNISLGASWVFTRNNNLWTQKGSKLVGTDVIGFSNQGSSVSISADGNTALVGGYTDNNNIGACWVFTHANGSWVQQGSKLVGTEAFGAPNQGFSVAISADGNTAITGGIGDNNNTGASWIYVRTNGNWTQQGNKLIGIGASVPSNQGSSVSISADGNTAIIGGNADNSNKGASWIFTRSLGVWTQQGNRLTGANAIGSPGQGSSVPISADGNTSVIGGPNDNFSAGTSWIYSAITPCKVTNYNAFPDSIKACGDSIILNAKPGYTSYTWNTGDTTQKIIVKQNAKYSVTVTDANGCVGVDSTAVHLLKADILQNDISICKGSSVQLNISADGANCLDDIYSVSGYRRGFTGSRNNNIVSFEIDLSGYSPKRITAIDAQTYIADFADLGSSGWHYVITFDCATKTILDVKPDSTMASQITQNSFVLLAPPTYDAATNTMHIYSGYTNITGNDRNIDETFIKQSTFVYPTYSWSTGETSASITVSPDQPTTYYCTVNDGISNCTDSVKVSVVTAAKPTITASKNIAAVCPKDSVTLTSSSAATYLWNTGATTQSINVKSKGRYGVSITDIYGCAAQSDTSSVAYQSCSNPAGLAVSNIARTNAQLSWAADSCAVGYQYEWRKKGTTFWTWTQTTGNTKNITGLAPNTTYQWRVIKACRIRPDTVKSGYTNGPEFTTLASGAVNNNNIAAQQKTSDSKLQTILTPNPTTGNALLNISGITGKVQIKVSDAGGKTVWQMNASATGSIVIPAQNFVNGLYMVQVIGKTETIIIKLIKK